MANLDEVWQTIPGPSMKQVSVGPTWTWGVDINNNIYKCKTPCDGTWTQVDDRAKHVSAGATEVWNVGPQGGVWKRPVDGSGTWKNVPGLLLKQVSVGTNGQVWGVTDKGEVFTFTNNKWYPVKGSLSQIDVGTDSIWGVQANGDVYTKTNKDIYPNWVQIPGKLKYVSSDNENVVGLGMANEFKVCKKPCKGSWVTREGNFSQVDITDSNLAAVSAE